MTNTNKQKDVLYIHDTLFAHAKTSSWYNESKNFDWIREYDKDFLVFTDASVTLSDQFKNKKKYAWLLESPEIMPEEYLYVKNNYDKFDIIFTFDKELLSISEKFKLIPFGGCWIYEEDRKIHDKSKLVSLILSSKRITTGHKLRHQIKQRFSGIDYFGDTSYIPNKILGLKDYYFSVSIENCKKDYLFSEKLVDCFITGTIPIYWGCPSIDKFFDTDGMIIFDKAEDIPSIIESITPELYYDKMKSIKTNFELAKQYLIPDDLIYSFLKGKE
ncbi:MAG: hypothetical protein ACO3CQ_00580 [Candidatus Nanopelagicaceae bacterium]